MLQFGDVLEDETTLLVAECVLNELDNDGLCERWVSSSVEDLLVKLENVAVKFRDGDPLLDDDTVLKVIEFAKEPERVGALHDLAVDCVLVSDLAEEIE